MGREKEGRNGTCKKLRNSECRQSDTSKKFSVPAQLLREWESLHSVSDPSK